MFICLENKRIRVKDGKGTLRTVEWQIQRSVHGPVIMRNQQKAIAMRVVGLDRPDITKQYWQMMRAKNLSEFLAGKADSNLGLANKHPRFNAKRQRLLRTPAASSQCRRSTVAGLMAMFYKMETNLPETT